MPSTLAVGVVVQVWNCHRELGESANVCAIVPDKTCECGIALTRGEHLAGDRASGGRPCINAETPSPPWRFGKQKKSSLQNAGLLHFVGVNASSG